MQSSVPDAGLVADRDDRSQSQSTLLEREVDRHVAALRDDGRLRASWMLMPCSSGQSATRSNVLTNP